MAAASDYITGTISLTNGQVGFTGAGTGWLLAQFKEGDTIIDITGATEFMGVIATIDANGAGTLTKAWEGPTLTNVAYRMRYQSDGARVSAQARNLIELLGDGTLLSLAGLSGPGVIELLPGGGAQVVPKTDLVSGANYDVQVANLAARAAYNGQAQGYAVLVSDIGDGRAAIYSKLSNTSGDWSAPAYITGAIGASPTLSAAVTPTAVGTTPAVVTTPVSGGYSLDFQLPIPRSEGHPYRWSTTTSDANPGNGLLRANNATLSSATILYISKTTRAGSAIGAFLNSMDDSTNTVKGDLTLQRDSDGATVTWRVSGTITDTTSYVKVPVTGIAGLTAIANNTDLTLRFTRAGDRGANGAGTVASVAAGTGVSVNSSDATAPVVSVVPFTGDSGSGGTVGGVPAPSAGDAAAGKVLGAGGAWVSQAGEETVQSYWMPSNLELAELSPAALLIGMGDGNGVFDGFNNLAYVDVAGATGADVSVTGQIKPSASVVSTWSDTLNNNTTGWTNFNVRLRVAASLITTSGVSVRLTMKGVSSGSTLVVSGMYIGHKATSGDAYDFDGSQVPVTVGGNTAFNVAAGATVVSDWITFPLDEAKDVIVAFYSTSGDLRTKTGGTSSTLDMWSKAGSSEISTSNVTGYNQSGSADIGLIDNIEVTTAFAAMTVRSQNISLAEAPNWARLVAIVQQNSAGVNSDVVFKLSRNGSAFTTLVMAEKFTRGDGSVYVDSGLVDLSGITTGTAARWRIETYNAKGPAIKAIGVLFGVNS